MFIPPEALRPTAKVARLTPRQHRPPLPLLPRHRRLLRPLPRSLTVRQVAQAP